MEEQAAASSSSSSSSFCPLLSFDDSLSVDYPDVRIYQPEKKRHQKQVNVNQKKEEERKKRQREKEEAIEYCRNNIKYDELGFVSNNATSSPPSPLRVLFVISYIGTTYSGNQLQNRTQLPTIENQLLHALYRCGAISNSPSVILSDLQLQRTARTDAGVHASGNLIAMLIQPVVELNVLLVELNKMLKEKYIQIIDIFPVCSVKEVEHYANKMQSTSSSSSASQYHSNRAAVQAGDVCEFHARNSCTGRVYEYLLPNCIWGVHTKEDELNAQKQEELRENEKQTSGPVLTDAQRIDGRELHRLLKSQQYALASLRSDSIHILVSIPSAAAQIDTHSSSHTPASTPSVDQLLHLHHTRLQDLYYFRDLLPALCNQLKNVREILHNMRNNLDPFVWNESEEKSMMNRLNIKIAKEEGIELSRIAELGKKVVNGNTHEGPNNSSTESAESSSSSSFSQRHLSASALCLVAFANGQRVVNNNNNNNSKAAESKESINTKAILFPMALFEGFRLSPQQINNINSILSLFIGTFDFHNFTKLAPGALPVYDKPFGPITNYKKKKNNNEKKQEEKPEIDEEQQEEIGEEEVPTSFPSPSPPDANSSASSSSHFSSPAPPPSTSPHYLVDPVSNYYTRRSVWEFAIIELVVRDGVEYSRIKIKGQSFMLHQIRKMIGLAIMATRGLVDTKQIFNHVFDSNFNCEVQAAPARGLLLCGMSFDRYERMCSISSSPSLHSISSSFSRTRLFLDDFKVHRIEQEICLKSDSYQNYRQFVFNLQDNADKVVNALKDKEQEKDTKSK